MTESRYVVLIDKLIQKTEEGQTVWRKAERDSAFRLNFRRGNIVIDHWTGDNNSELVDMIIYNERGEKVDSLNFGDIAGQVEYSRLIELYNLVRRRYLRIEETIEGLLEELDGDEIIGEDRFSYMSYQDCEEGEEGDIPF